MLLEVGVDLEGHARLGGRQSGEPEGESPGRVRSEGRKIHGKVVCPGAVLDELGQLSFRRTSSSMEWASALSQTEDTGQAHLGVVGEGSLAGEDIDGLVEVRSRNSATRSRSTPSGISTAAAAWVGSWG